MIHNPPGRTEGPGPGRRAHQMIKPIVQKVAQCAPIIDYWQTPLVFVAELCQSLDDFPAGLAIQEATSPLPVLPTKIERASPPPVGALLDRALTLAPTPCAHVRWSLRYQVC